MYVQMVHNDVYVAVVCVRIVLNKLCQCANRTNPYLAECGLLAKTR